MKTTRKPHPAALWKIIGLCTLMATPLAHSTGPVERTIDLVPGFNLVGLEVLPDLVVSGTFESPLTDDDADFFATLGTEVESGRFLLIANEGGNQLLKKIVSWDRNSLVIEDGSYSGEYRIHRQPTIRSIFGAFDESQLNKGGPDYFADLIWVPSGDGTYTRIYNSEGQLIRFPPINDGWRAVGNGDVDYSDYPINPLYGLIIERRPASPLSIPITGHHIAVDNLVPPVLGFIPFARRHTDPLTVGELLDHALAISLDPGDENSADILWLPNGDGTYDRVYLNNVTKPFPPTTPGWRRIGRPGDEDASGLLIPSAFMVERRQ